MRHVSYGLAGGLIAATLMFPTAGFGQQESDCKSVQLTTANWTGEAAKTYTAEWLLDQLGYDAKVTEASVQIMFQSMASGDSDVGTWSWLPSQRSMIKPYMLDGEIDKITINMPDAKYTVAVPTYVYEAGVTSFADLDDHRDKFNGKIYGIEAGNDGNKIIKQMINDDVHGLGDWELVSSSQAGMLSQVKRHTNNNEWIAFLGWSPHPMNIQFDLKYLAGGAEYWGPNKGGARVYTWSHVGWAWRCPNAGQFFENFKFTAEEQSLLGLYIEQQGMEYPEAGRHLIKENPELLDRWFGNGGTYQTGPVKTFEGSEKAPDVIRSALGL